MKIFIDADGCPVVDIVLNTTAQFCVEAVILFDALPRIPAGGCAHHHSIKGGRQVDSPW